MQIRRMNISFKFVIYTVFFFHFTSLSTSIFWDCNRTWPQLELFLPVGIKHKHRLHEWKDLFLKTYLLFWPIKLSNTNLLFIIDEEHRTHVAVKDIQKELASNELLQNRSRIAFNYIHSDIYNFDGWKRQQYLMFYGDNFTASEYIGFVDTDCVFITYVDREDLFEVDQETKAIKPVINGKIGDPTKRLFKEEPVWYEITRTTYEILGLLTPMKCMSYFPVIIKRQHLAEIREFLEKKYNMPFQEIFRQKISPNWFGQFDFFCTYLFNFRQSEYAWYAHDISPEWDGVSPPPMFGQNSNKSVYSQNMFFPKPRIALHARYNVPEIAPDNDLFANILQTGVCFSPPLINQGHIEFPRCFYYSTSKHLDSVFLEELFKFERYRWDAILSKDQMLSAMLQRLERIRHCSFDFNGNNVSSIMEAFPLREDMPFFTPQMGRQIFVHRNGTIFTFAAYGKFVSLGYSEKPLGQWDSSWLRGFDIVTL